MSASPWPETLYGYRTYNGRVYCTVCPMPDAERQLRYTAIDATGSALRCAACNKTLGEVQIATAKGANEAAPTHPALETLSVRACAALRRYYDRRNEAPNLKTRTTADLLAIDARDLWGMGNVGPKTIVELRNAALAAGGDLKNADVILRTPSALGPWEIRETRLQGEHLAVTLHCAGANLKLLRAKSEASQLTPGTWVRVDLVPCDPPTLPDPTPPTEESDA